jgi:hypothetical protein
MPGNEWKHLVRPGFARPGFARSSLRPVCLNV